MKRTIFTLTLLIMGSSFIIGQNKTTGGTKDESKTKVIIYDYENGLLLNKKGKRDTVLRVSTRDYSYVSFRITNIKKLAYNIKITAKGRSIDPDDSGFSVLQAISGQRDVSVSTDEDKEAQTVGNNQDAEPEKSTSEKRELTAIDSLEILEKLFLTSLSKIQKISDLNNFLDNQIVMGSQELNIKGNTGFKSSDYQGFYQEFKNEMEKAKTTLRIIGEILSGSSQTLTKPVRATWNVKYKSLTDQYNEKELLEKINSFLFRIEAFLLYNKVRDEKEGLGQKPFEFLTVRLDNDAFEFTTEIKLKDQFRGRLMEKGVPKITIETYGRRKVNTSAGIFYTTLIDHVYKVREVENADSPEENQEIFRENEGAFNHGGVGAMAHFYRTSPSGTQAGFGLGTLVSQDGRIQFLSGVSFMFGETQRLVVNLGLSAGSVKRLGGGQVEGTLISDPQGILTKDVFRLGGFIAFTYNFSKN